MFILDMLSFVDYLLEISHQISNIEHWTDIWGIMPFINVFMMFIAARVVLSWLLLEKLLKISGKIYIIFLSIPIITTEAIIRDVVLGIERATEIVNERGIGEYTVFTKILFEILYEKNIPDIAIYISGVIICEVSRILPIYFIKKR